MTAEHEALVLSLCTRGLMPPRARYALLADLRDSFASGTKFRTHCEEIRARKYASARLCVSCSRNLENFISATIYSYGTF